MKKLLLLVALLVNTLIATSQTDTTKLSNYEKYLLAKEQSSNKVDTLYNTDTVYVGKEEKPEYDDLYYTPSKDKKVKKIRKPYVDPVQAFVDTLKKDNPNITVNVYELDPFYYSNRIGRFYYGGFNYWRYSNPWYYNYWYGDFGWGWVA